MMRAIQKLGLHQIEQVTDPLHEPQLLGRKPDMKFALDSHHQPDQVDRIEPERLAQILIVLRQFERFAHLLFE
jgi:hypothetical protein